MFMHSLSLQQVKFFYFEKYNFFRVQMHPSSFCVASQWGRGFCCFRAEGRKKASGKKQEHGRGGNLHITFLRFLSHNFAFGG